MECPSCGHMDVHQVWDEDHKFQGYECNHCHQTHMPVEEIRRQAMYVVWQVLDCSTDNGEIQYIIREDYPEYVKEINAEVRKIIDEIKDQTTSFKGE